jgi:hypothetical protein
VRFRFGLVAAALCLVTCKVSIPLDGPARFVCSNDADCAGDNYKCTAQSGAMGYCCKPDGAEVCDGKDNDCNGLVDDTNQAEICNGKDDNCDGKVDEGFNLQSDTMNCGMCNHTCLSTEVCMGGQCSVRKETDCNDGVDNDGNGKTDCEDPSCEGGICGGGCLCKNGSKTEAASACHDGMDNDGDGLTDCADPDCLMQACGPGCACGADAGVSEVVCNDDFDNDGDGLIDCLDPDCDKKVCGTASVPFTCNLGVCNCNGGMQVAESGALCSDGLDNDCNGKSDCADVSCDNAPCTLADGGSGSCTSSACE